jgi:hypothetical protein
VCWIDDSWYVSGDGSFAPGTGGATDLIYAVVLIVVIPTVYGIFHNGGRPRCEPRGSTAGNHQGIDLAKL